MSGGFLVSFISLSLKDTLQNEGVIWGALLSRLLYFKEGWVTQP